MNHRTLKIEISRRAKGERKWPVTISSEYPVTRSDRSGPYDEILSHEAGAVNLERAPLPVLEGHDASRTNIGLIDDLRINDRRLRGVLVLGSSQRALELAPDIDAGIVSGLSIGYEISETATEQGENGTRRIVATRWTPYECSIVGVPADDTIGIGRSKTMGDTDDSDQNTDRDADDTEERCQGAHCRSCDEHRDDKNENESSDTDKEADNERSRCAAIVRLTREQSVRHMAEPLIKKNVPLSRARQMILRELQAYDRSLPGGGAQWNGDSANYSNVSGGHNIGDFRAAASDALCQRAGIPIKSAHPASQDFSASTHEIARICSQRAGKRMTGRGTPEMLIRGALTAGDFPNILSDSMHKAIRSGYEQEPATHRQWVKVVNVPDFRLQHRPILGSAPALTALTEIGEYENGAMTDDEASYQVSKFGRLVTLSLQALVNDDLGAFLRVQPAMGQAARRIEADTTYNLFGNNANAGPTMQDSHALFDATNHSNVAGAGAFSAVLLGAARALLRKQTMLGGGYMNLVPRFLLVSPDLEQVAETLLAASTRIFTVANNPQDNLTSMAESPKWLSGLSLIVEPRLSSSYCWLVAENGQIDTFELGVLDSGFMGPGPSVELENPMSGDSFRTDSMTWKVRHVFGVKALDWRGMVQAPII